MPEMFVNFVPTKFDIDISKFLLTCLSRKGRRCHARMFSLNMLFYQFRFMVLVHTTFNKISVISWRSASLVEEAGPVRLYHRPPYTQLFAIFFETRMPFLEIL
jgi:hypothetical protein